MRLNYQHLLHFWTVVRAGNLTRTCEELNLNQANADVDDIRSEEFHGY